MSTAPATVPLDLLGFVFRGAQVIEASAGTGKTWTVASLYLRLVLGEGPTGAPLRPPDILVMTFTDAATQELRERIRLRLAEAAAVFRGADPKAHDAFLAGLRACHRREDWPALARRLEGAGQWMDEAAIHTIHGWSSRMLRKHAFDSRSLFEQQRVEDPKSLLAAVVRDYWRQHIYPLDPATLDALQGFPPSPDALLTRIRRQLAQLERAPGAEHALAAPTDLAPVLAGWAAWAARVAAAERAARGAWRTHRDALEAQLRAAMARTLHGNVYRKASHEAYLATMRDWSEGEPLSVKELERFSARKLAAATKKGESAPVDATGAYAALDALVDARVSRPDDAPLYLHAAVTVRHLLAARKRQRAQFDFDDLLQRLYLALQAGDGRLAQAIRRQYPVALVDEFQDTDPWQYGALTRIYLDPAPEPAALVMIGDPKQAIYSFRGADLATYLQARERADGIHTLTVNYRSTPALVQAVNHIFGTATGAWAPFDPIRYEPVSAARSALQGLVSAAGRPHPAVTVWYPPQDGAERTATLRERMAEGFATQLVGLLRDGAVQPREVAVLVRNFAEAHCIRRALEARGVRSVYLSDRDSVYATDEARDLWYILRATAEPRAVGAIRAALSTRCFGHSPEALDRLLAEEAAFERAVEDFVRWQETWQRQGLLPMLYALLHEQQIPARLLALGDVGERRLTNLLHLGDLLQQASLGLQGEIAVVRHLANQLREPKAGGDAVQMRLETDEDLVKVVTVHKAKGLQYPAVFLPFAYDFRPSTEDDAARLREDLRLLYVAFTRAERALFIGAATRSQDLPKDGGDPKSSLGRLLGRRRVEDLAECLARWSACPDIFVAPLPEPTDARVIAANAPTAHRRALQPQRRHASRWRSTSFSALTRGLAEREEAPRGLNATDADERYLDARIDAPAQEDAATGTGSFEAFPAGAKYGDLLHALLEWQVKADWPLLREAADPAWEAVLARRCAPLDLEASHRALLVEWLQAIGRCRLPLAAGSSGESGGPMLGALRGTQRWAEMGFVITTRGVDARTVDQLVSAHTLPGQPREALAPGALEGLLTGFLDLVFEAGGRYYVLDYKSNRLGRYGRPALEAAVLAHRYDLQYALYLLALHRLLGARLPDYDYDRHVGGAIYLFARGIGSPGDGIYADRPDRRLIESLDAAFRTAVP